MSRIENGKQNLKMLDIEKIAAVLEVRVKELFTGRGDEKTSSSSLVHSLLSYTFPPLAAALCAFAMALPLT
jgi:hypothetical protein